MLPKATSQRTIDVHKLTFAVHWCDYQAYIIEYIEYLEYLGSSVCQICVVSVSTERSVQIERVRECRARISASSDTSRNSSQSETRE